MKLLDTTVAIDHLRGDEKATQLLERLTDEGEPLLASELSRFELLAGMRPVEQDPTELFMGALTWVPVNEEIARLAGSMAAEYPKGAQRNRCHRLSDRRHLYRRRCRPPHDQCASLPDDLRTSAALRHLDPDVRTSGSTYHFAILMVRG